MNTPQIPNLNDIVRLRRPTFSPPGFSTRKIKPGFMVWKVSGIYLGGSGHEGLVGLQRLDAEPGSANGQTVAETLIPIPLFCALRDGRKVE